MLFQRARQVLVDIDVGGRTVFVLEENTDLRDLDECAVFASRIILNDSLPLIEPTFRVVFAAVGLFYGWVSQILNNFRKCFVDDTPNRFLFF